MAVALQLTPAGPPSHRLLAALMGSVGSLWLAATITRGRSPALFATFAFIAAAVLTGAVESLPGAAPFARLFAAAGLALYAARASGGRVPRVLASLSAVLGAAWVVGTHGAEMTALLDWTWMGTHASAIGALTAGVLVGSAESPIR